LNLVIDAQIVGGFYKESVLDCEHDCTASPSALFSRLGDLDLGFLDDGNQIEAEWRRVAEIEWFDSWLADRFVAGAVCYVKTAVYPHLIKHLCSSCGFPAKGRDSWYVRTAKTVVDSHNAEVALITEDLDFFNPKAKGGAGNRKSVLTSGKGPVEKALKKEGVLVRTVDHQLA
jgi:hypothetical protein